MRLGVLILTQRRFIPAKWWEVHVIHLSERRVVCCSQATRFLLDLTWTSSASAPTGLTPEREGIDLRHAAGRLHPFQLITLRFLRDRTAQFSAIISCTSCRNYHWLRISSTANDDVYNVYTRHAYLLVPYFFHYIHYEQTTSIIYSSIQQMSLLQLYFCVSRVVDNSHCKLSLMWNTFVHVIQ